MSPAHRVWDTWRALLAPRRLVPILLVACPLIAAQYAFGGDRAATLLAVGMCLAFMAIGPASFRLAFPSDPSREGARGGTGPKPPASRRRISGPELSISGLFRLAAYAAVGALPGVIAWYWPQYAGVGRSFLTGGVNLAVTITLFWVGGWGLARDIDLEQGLERASARARALEEAAEHARLLALRSQLDPHFLFNTLNAIAEWCREDALIAEQAILRLSKLMRTVLEGVGPSAWPLGRELDLVGDLLELHRVRDPSQFQLRLDIDPELREARVPPLLLLPLAENAMTHGVRKGHRGTVSLRVAREGDMVVLHLDNPGAWQVAAPAVHAPPGTHEDRGRGQGLSMARRRLRLAYGDRASLELGPVEGAEHPRVRCTLRWPEQAPRRST